VRTGQLTVDRCLARSGGTCTDWREGVLGVTLTVATPTMHAAMPPVSVAAGGSIQAAIDAATPGTLILVPPGSYEQMVVMSKPVRLQGWGAASTRISVVQSPAENLQAWRDRMGDLLANQAYLLPDQVNILGLPPFADGALAAALGGEGAGVTVLGQNIPSPREGADADYCGSGPTVTTGLSAGDRYCLQNENHPSSVATAAWRPNARIDGFSIHGSSNSAGIVVNGNARYAEISNNWIFNNLSTLAGGIKIGHPGAELELADNDANNDNVAVHNNHVSENAGLGAGGGGGIVIGTGADNYRVRNNWVAGNYTGGQGAGISHRGLSPGGVIDRNTIVFNESFNQGQTVSGGGLFVGGRAPTPASATPGSGSVRLSNNLIQGNQAGAGDGGGIALVGVNDANGSFGVDVFNNVIVNNEAGLAGGGIALQNARNVRIIHSTVAYNDSLATAGVAFVNPTTSAAQPAGIVSRGANDPQIVNSILWHNRSFYFSGNTLLPAPTAGTAACSMPTYAPPNAAPTGNWRCWDLGVLGGGGALAPQYSVLTSTAGYAGTNSSAQPSFVARYANGARNQTVVLLEATTIQVPAAFDEGGNFFRPLFGPLSLTRLDPSPNNSNDAVPFWGNYHVTAGVDGQPLGGPPASTTALFPGSSTDLWANVPLTLRSDFDAEARPLTPDRGADEKLAAPAPTTPVPTRR
jgi:hypothetical protein